MAASSVKQVFISHATTADGEFAQRLAGDLRRLGVKVWIAPESIQPGEAWVDAIERGLGESSHIVIVLTPAALKSVWVKRETNAAMDLESQGRIHVIPLDVEPCEAPLLLGSLQMIRFRQGYDVGIGQLANLLELPVKPPAVKEKEQPQPFDSRLRSLPRLALAGLLALVLLVGVVAVWLSGLGGDLFRPPTATGPVVVAPPTTETLVRTLVREKDGMEMVYVPGDTFEMGSTDGADNERPVHTVTLDSFWIDRTEVTNAQYAGCVAAGVCSPPSESSSVTHASYYGDSQFDDYPVINVGWEDADTYCQWAGGRLPTEAEWEYAARGPEGRVYPWGNNPPDDTLLNYDGNVGDTTPVGSYAKGESWVGALDMAGNVLEWVNDWYDNDYYGASPAKNPAGPDTGDSRVLRGGSWDNGPYYMRSASRFGTNPGNRYYYFGLRCVVASTSSP